MIPIFANCEGNINISLEVLADITIQSPNKICNLNLAQTSHFEDNFVQQDQKLEQNFSSVDLQLWPKEDSVTVLDFQC